MVLSRFVLIIFSVFQSETYSRDAGGWLYWVLREGQLPAVSSTSPVGRG